MKIIVIGGGASGMMFSSQYHKKKPEDEIVVFEKYKWVSWAGCPTPYYIANELSFDNVVLRSPEDFIKQGIQVNINSEVQEVNYKDKYVVVNGTKHSYDKLVIASGAKARIQEGFTLTHIKGAEEIKNFVDNNSPKNALILGAGFVGIELAEALIKRGLKVDLVELGSDIFPTVSKELKEELYKEIEKSGLKLHLNSNINDFDKSKYDMFISSAGVTPNLDYLPNELETKDGKILVNEYFETNLEDVYAIGDSVYNRYINEDFYQYSPQGDVANKHGYLLASNLSGDKREWKGTIGSFASSYFDVKIAGTGLSLKRALDLGYNAKSFTLKAQTENSGFKDFKPIKMEVIYDADTNVVLGASAVGYDAVAQFIDQMAIVIVQKIGIENFINIDFCYSPTNSSVWNPLLLTYRKVIK